MTDAEIRQHWRTGFVFWHVDGDERMITRVESGRIYFERTDRVEQSIAWDRMGTIVGEKPRTPYRPPGRFIEVPYPSFPDWVGIVWPADGPLIRPKDGRRLPSDQAVLASTGWRDFAAYQAATGNTECQAGKAWLGPDRDDRLKFLTGVMSTPIAEVRRGRRRF